MSRNQSQLPRPFIYAGMILLVLVMIPPAVIAYARATHSPLPRIQLQQDMGVQNRFDTQQANPMFRDGRAMRPRTSGTVARGHLREDEHFYDGMVGDDWADTIPIRIEVDRAFLERGRERYDIFCAICHGVAGFGDGMVHNRAQELVESGRHGTVWVPPTDLHSREILEKPVGELYHVITHGARNMAGYASQIPVEDRWAIAAYVQAMQISQNADQEDDS